MDETGGTLSAAAATTRGGGSRRRRGCRVDHSAETRRRVPPGSSAGNDTRRRISTSTAGAAARDVRARRRDAARAVVFARAAPGVRAHRRAGGVPDLRRPSRRLVSTDASQPRRSREPGPIRPGAAFALARPAAADDPDRSRGGAATRLYGLFASQPRRRRDSSPRNSHVAATRPCSKPPPGRGDVASAEYPHLHRGVAATSPGVSVPDETPLGISTSRPRGGAAARPRNVHVSATAPPDEKTAAGERVEGFADAHYRTLLVWALSNDFKLEAVVSKKRDAVSKYRGGVERSRRGGVRLGSFSRRWTAGVALVRTRQKRARTNVVSNAGTRPRATTPPTRGRRGTTGARSCSRASRGVVVFKGGVPLAACRKLAPVGASRRRRGSVVRPSVFYHGRFASRPAALRDAGYWGVPPRVEAARGSFEYSSGASDRSRSVGRERRMRCDA